MRGFNLFAAFLGVAMIAIAAGYALYTTQEKTAKTTHIMDELVRFDTAGVADVIKSDVYNTVLVKMRKDFQDYFATRPIEPPEYVWGSESAFKNWFEKDFAQSEALTYWLADRMIYELQAYTSSNIFGEEYEVSISGSVKATADALKGAVSAKILDDGTFIYIIDTTKMGPEAYGNLPKILVRKRGESSGFTTDVVIPRGKWTIPVPLRIMDAYRVARAAKGFMESGERYKKLALAVGHCDPNNLAICDAFLVEPSYVEPVSNSKDAFTPNTVVSSLEGYSGPRGSLVSPCTQQYMDYTKIIEATGMDWPDFVEMMKKTLQRQKEELEKELAREDLSEDERTYLENYYERIVKALDDLSSPDAIDTFRKGPCSDDTESLASILSAAASSISHEAIRSIKDVRGENGERLIEGTENFAILPDLDVYRRYETARVVRRTAINILKILCQETVGITDIACAILGIPRDKCVCDRVSSLTGSYGTISFDTCQISGSVYCVAPEEYSYIVMWSDPDERYRVGTEPATFQFRVVEGKIDFADQLKVLEDETEEISVSTTGEEELEDEKKEICRETLSTMAEYLPEMTGGCIENYVATTLKCSDLDEKTIEYVLTGVPPSLQEYCKNCGENCSDPRCSPDGDDSQKRLEGICKRLEKIGYSSDIPGFYRGRGLPEFACIDGTELDDAAKSCLSERGVVTDAERICFGKDAAEACGLTSVYNANVAENWLSMVEDDPWFCDPYVGESSPITAVKNAVKKVLDKINSWANVLCQMAGVRDVQDLVSGCEKNPSVGDIVKSISPLGMSCANARDYGTYRANELSAEYNNIYYNYIGPTIAAIQSAGGYGNCSADSPEIQSLIQSFSPPTEVGGGDVKIPSGGNCHPEHMLDMAARLAEMRQNSIKCNIDGPENQTLFETTWMHIGSEIYATCSVGEARP